MPICSLNLITNVPRCDRLFLWFVSICAHLLLLFVSICAYFWRNDPHPFRRHFYTKLKKNTKKMVYLFLEILINSFFIPEECCNDNISIHVRNRNYFITMVEICVFLVYHSNAVGMVEDHFVTNRHKSTQIRGTSGHKSTQIRGTNGHIL